MIFDYEQAWKDWNMWCDCEINFQLNIHDFIKSRPDIAKQIEEALTYNKELKFYDCLKLVYVKSTKLGKALK